MAEKFTPGPWVIGALNCIWPASDLKFENGNWDAACDNPRIIHDISHKPTSTDMANAHLIASAPELYEALKETLAIAERNEVGGYAVRARAALSKARGD